MAPADGPQPSVIVLPPRIVSGASDQVNAAAELACDRLAQELEKTKTCQVVDRTQLDHILKERKLGTGSSAKMVAYDAIVRLEVDAARPVPLLRLNVIGLSEGNVLDTMQFPWTPTLPSNVLRDMAKATRAAIGEAVQPGRNVLRVRLLEVENVGKSARLEPLAASLREVFDAALERSKAIRLVHHLEAQSAKEESLLLMMGLAQLPDGRQFAPQSDATIELRIRELDGIGKTFEQTQLEVSWRVRKGVKYEGQWSSAQAAVKESGGLMKTAWSKCSQSLGQVSPQAAGEYLDEMALRRKQAQAEMEAAPNARGVDLLREAGRHQHLAHVAAAAKLDPAWEEAGYALVFATANDFRDGVDYDFDAREAGIYEALRYLQRFKTDGKHRAIVADAAIFWRGIDS